jgi:hypothetical protein
MYLRCRKQTTTTRTPKCLVWTRSRGGASRGTEGCVEVEQYHHRGSSPHISTSWWRPFGCRTPACGPQLASRSNSHRACSAMRNTSRSTKKDKFVVRNLLQCHWIGYPYEVAARTSRTSEASPCATASTPDTSSWGSLLGEDVVGLVRVIPIGRCMARVSFG